MIHDNEGIMIKSIFIGENNRQICDSMHYLEETDSEGLLSLADFEKKIDSVS